MELNLPIGIIPILKPPDFLNRHGKNVTKGNYSAAARWRMDCTRYFPGSAHFTKGCVCPLGAYTAFSQGFIYNKTGTMSCLRFHIYQKNIGSFTEPLSTL